MKFFKKIKVYYFLLSVPSFTKCLSSILWSFGVLWLVVKIINYFFGTWATENIQPLWWLFLITGVIVALLRNIPKTSYTCKINNTDTSVEIRVGDIFDTNETIVLGTNTTFDTTMEDGTISPRSVQGQFTSKYCSSVNELDGKLSTALLGITPKLLSDSEKPYGKTNQYPIGTVTQVGCLSRKAYFVAIAHMNKTKAAQSNTQNILDALPELWEFIRTHGEPENICIPIIGSVFARVKATKEILIQEILRSFVAACCEGKFCEKITLFIHPDDIKNRRVDFDNAVDFLKYICAYENKRIDSQIAETGKSEVITNNQLNKHIKATCFLLEDDGDSFGSKKDFGIIIENVAGTIEKALPALLEARNFKEFIEKCNKSLAISEKIEFNPQEQMKRPRFKQFSTGCLPPDYRKTKQWALDFDNNVYLNENAKNLFNAEFVKLKVSIEQV